MANLKLQLLTELLKILPEAGIIQDEETLRPYECDGLSIYTEMPLMVVLPDSVEQVQKIIRLCSRLETPIVPRGAGTGLSAGAMPHREGVVVSLAKFNRILSIDADARQARVQPGVRNLAISEAAQEYGLYYAPDPSSQIACSIGGNVAENSGGVHCLKYGLTVHNILALEVVTAEGDILRIGNQGYDSCGFDLLSLYIGSEGLLGIVTEITVKLLPVPETTKVVMATFDRVEKAGDAVKQIIAEGIIPAGLEMMDRLAINAAEDFVHAGYPRDTAAMLLCEIDGMAEEVDEHIARVSAVFNKEKAGCIRVAADENERQRLWKGRKAAFPAIGRISPDYYCMDGTIPRSQLTKVLTTIQSLSDIYQLRVANVFHAGDGNLHPLILFDANVAGELEKTEEFGGKILELCVDAGGCITGEHGVGVEKLLQMPYQFDPASLEQFQRVKLACDPQRILNPGKGIPQLKHCQEYRSLSQASVGRHADK